MRLIPVLALVIAVLAPGSHARAAWFAPDTLDTGVAGLAGVDLHRDGAGAVAYLKGTQLLVARRASGAWRAPEAIRDGITEAAIAAGRDHRLAVTYVAGGTLFGAVAPGGEGPQPFAAPVALASAGLTAPIGSLSLDMGPNGHAYAVWTQGGDVRAARLDRFERWEAVPEPLDIDPARDAGSGSDRPRVAAGADGHAVVVWGEAGAVWERRLLRTRLSQVPQQAGAGTAPVLGLQDDTSFASLAWRDGAQARWRRLIGSAFEAPVELGTGEPAIAVDGSGMGFAAVASGSGELTGRSFDGGVAGAPLRLDTAGAATAPAVALGELGELVVAWRGPDGIVGRASDQTDLEPMGPETVLSRPGLPAPGPPAAASDATGNAVVAMLQGDALVAADHDRAPGKPAGGASENWGRKARPQLRWRAGDEQWGPQEFRVLVDGVLAATTSRERVRLAAKLADGEYDWVVQAVDRRGQTTASDARSLRIDTTKPSPRLKILGARRPGSVLRVVVRARDRLSGVEFTKLTFPDGTTSTEPVVRRAFRAGRHSIKLGVVDEAGNVARRSFTLTVR